MKLLWLAAIAEALTTSANSICPLLDSELKRFAVALFDAASAGVMA